MSYIILEKCSIILRNMVRKIFVNLSISKLCWHVRLRPNQYIHSSAFPEISRRKEAIASLAPPLNPKCGGIS